MSSASPLGRPTRFPKRYDPDLLFTVERATQRAHLGIATALPFSGLDQWTAWELHWLDAGGRPAVGVCAFRVPCESPRIVESKSVKLWLASLYAERFASPADLQATLVRDLNASTGGNVDVDLLLPDAWSQLARRESVGDAIDEHAAGTFSAAPEPGLLRANGDSTDEVLVNRTFRSLCPVTAQPDYACVSIAYRGPKIDRVALATYLAGFREHPDFHEHCVEKIFCDLWRACAPESLTVEARFTRRGGVDISPLRSSHPIAPGPLRPDIRQ